MIANLPLSKRVLSGDLAIPFYFSVGKLLLHLIVNAQGGYGLFRDEFYYIACSNHLAAGYVDQPPLSAYLLRLNILLFGDSLFSIRFIPAVCAALTVWITGLMTYRLGGGRLAMLVACALTFSIGNLVMSSFYSMNALEILSWTLAAYVILLIIQTGEKKYWIYLGFVLGLGLLNKVGMLFFGAGIFAGLLFTKERKWLATPWPYVAGAIAFVLFLPYVIWNIQHDNAHLEFINNASSQKYSGLSMLSFVVGQVLINNPVAVVIWLPGLLALCFAAQFRHVRFLAFLYVVPFFILLVNKTSKEVYLLPAYSVLWAVGGVWFEGIAHRYRYAKIAGFAGMVLWLITAVVFLPMVLPVLPVQSYISYADQLGFKPESAESKEQAELPQFYADMFGWEEKTKTVASVFNSLPEHERKKAGIFSDNYGRCASIDYHGKAYGLPATIGNHNNYWIWGPGKNIDPLIILGGRAEDHEKAYQEVELAAISDCQYCMPYENHVPVYVCRGLKADLSSLWPQIKNFN